LRACALCRSWTMSRSVACRCAIIGTQSKKEEEDEPPLDPLWTPSGPPLDPFWTPSGPPLERRP
jgi:hypothetical protein